MEKDDASLFIPFLTLLMAIWDSVDEVPFVWPVNVVVGVVGPGGGDVDTLVILIMFSCLKVLYCFHVRARRCSA